jgi:hypothetical protein
VNTLAHIQRDFIQALFDDTPADAGLETYRRTVHANLRGALASVYPVVLRLVGEAFFAEAARLHARAMPSTSGDLNDYGARFAEFLAAYPHASGLAYLPDVARLEWALHESHGAAEAPMCDFTALASVPPESRGRIRLRLHPAVRLLESSHPILAIWEANQPERDGTPQRVAGPDRVRVRRDEGATLPELVGELEWTLLAAIARGATLDEAATDLGDAAADFLGPALLRLATSGVVCSFDVAP